MMVNLLVTLALLGAVGTVQGHAAQSAGPVTLEVTGEAAGSDLEAPREVCNRAKADAQRRALEQAVGTFLRAYTLVSNAQLVDDSIFTQVRGKIDRVEILKEERSPIDYGCRVRIKAVVAPQFTDPQAMIQIKAAVTRSEVKEGDEIGLQYQLNHDGYVYIFVVAADNAVTQLLPNQQLRENKAQAGRRYVFPPRESGIKLRAMLQPSSKQVGADERIKIIVTREPEPILERGFQEGFAMYDARSTGLISDLLKRLTQLEPSDWGEVTLEYRIVP